jgi:prepilin-type N-terminal cleavage/methylation domain-containing protein
MIAERRSFPYFCQGFTLIEVLIAIAIMSIVALAIGYSHTTFHTLFTMADRRSAIYADAQYAMRYIGKDIAKGVGDINALGGSSAFNPYNSSSNSLAISLRDAAGDVITYSLSGNTLTRNESSPPSGTPATMTILTNVVANPTGYPSTVFQVGPGGNSTLQYNQVRVTITTSFQLPAANPPTRANPQCTLSENFTTPQMSIN